DFCDASGLAVLVGTARRARLLGGEMRLAAPAPAVAAALRITGLDRQLLVFSTVPAAIGASQAQRRVSSGTGWNPKPPRVPGGWLKPAALARELAAPDPANLHRAVTALLAHADEWRDADPNRRVTPSLRTLARAHAGANHTARAEAARSLLSALIRHPLTYSPAVAATARDLRRLVESSSYGPALT
ncbi:MAG TPA: STAS domain-containing protein, partial [Streptosporangiaceae bacterium]